MKILKHPLVIIFSIISAILFGVFFKNFALKIGILGVIYISLLKMCVIPILITAIISSLAKLFQSESAKKYLKRIVTIYIIFLIIVGFFSLTFELVAQPGKNLSKSAAITIGKLLNKADKSNNSSTNIHNNGKEGILAFIKNIIPDNIFKALSNGYFLQILFFSIILGIASGFLPKEYSNQIISISEAFFHAFFIIIEWAIYILPFGLFCLIAKQIAGTGVAILFAMLKYLITIYIISAIIMIFDAIIIKINTGTSFIGAFLNLKESLLIGFGTQSTFAAIPSIIEGLIKNLKLNEELVNLIIPIGAVLCRFSLVILYSTTAVFAAQLYNVSLGFSGIITALVLSVVASIAASGAPGIITLTMSYIVLHPLGLPVEAIVILLIAIDPLIDPVITATNIFSNCAATTMIIGKNK